MGTFEKVVVIIKPDAVLAGKEQEIATKFAEVIQHIMVQFRTKLTEEDIYILYPDKVEANYFHLLLEFMTSSDVIVIIGEGMDASKNASSLKKQIRAEIMVGLDDEDVRLLKLGIHPRQEEITNANALRNLVHVGTAVEGNEKQIEHLLSKYVT